MDNFKPVNDELGHDAGDQLIQQVASRLTSIDLSGLEKNTPEIEKTHIAARLGGDEFVVLVTNLGSTPGAAKFADYLISTIADPYYLDAGNCSIGTSIGIARYPKDSANTNTLLECADIALYEAKGRGKNQHVLYSSELASGSERQSKFGERPCAWLFDNQFSLYFHPVFSLADIEEVVSVDAILRWQNPEFGTIQQEELLQIAAQKNLMTILDRRLIEQACCQIVKWKN